MTPFFFPFWGVFSIFRINFSHQFFVSISYQFLIIWILILDVLNGLIGGLKSGISYCGGNNIEDLQKNSEFIRITQAGRIESTHHDVKLI